MGSAGVRAVSLCEPQLIEKVNRFFIPLVLEIDHSPHIVASSRTAQGQQLLRTIDDIYARGNSLLRTIVVTPEGRIADLVEPMARPLAIATEVDGAISKLHLEPGLKLTTYQSSARRPDAALELRVVLRYTDPDFIARLTEKLHPYCGDFRPDTTSLGPPTRDWITLSADACRQLLPPTGLSAGDAYRIDDDVTKSMLVHFRPEPALMMARSDEQARSRVRRAQLVATVCAGNRARLEGELEMVHPGLRPDRAPEAPSDGNVVKMSVAGWLEWDPASQRITHLSLATRRAVYCAATGGEVHYEGVAYVRDAAH